jgi:phage N-6-adenine-methyltransferase
MDWATPPDLYSRIESRYGPLTLDVCATAENTKCERYFSPDVDGLSQPWAPYRCWMNPPYGRAIGRWAAKAQDESRMGALVVCLLPARTDTRWWHEHVMRSSQIVLIRGRVRFVGAASSAPFPSAVVVFAPPGTAVGCSRDDAGPRFASMTFGP